MYNIKLLINLNILRYPLTGIGYYTLNIVKELLKRNIDIVGIRNGKLLNKKNIRQLLEVIQSEIGIQKKIKWNLRLINTIRKVPFIYSIKFLLQSLKLKHTLSILAKKNYIYFEPCFVPFDYDGKVITTIHDLSFLIHSEFHPKARVDYLKSQLKRTIQVSSHLLTDSKVIVDEMLEYYPKSRNKLSALYLGVSENFSSMKYKDPEILLRRLGVKPKSFLLSVSTLEPRKNLARLVLAYKQLPEETRKQIPLVLVGEQGWKNTKLLTEISTLVNKNQIIVTGYLADDELPLLYSSAKIFIYPSLYEGFGLPIIEAMASGTAVITSNFGAMAEVAGDAALLVDPYSEESIFSGIKHLLDHQQEIEHLIKKGLMRAKQFTWEKTVDQLLEIVKGVDK